MVLPYSGVGAPYNPSEAGSYRPDVSSLARATAPDALLREYKDAAAVPYF